MYMKKLTIINIRGNRITTGYTVFFDSKCGITLDSLADMYFTIYIMKDGVDVI